MEKPKVISYTPQIGNTIKRLAKEIPVSETGKNERKINAVQYVRGLQKDCFLSYSSNPRYGYFTISDFSEYGTEESNNIYKIKVSDQLSPEEVEGDMWCRVMNKSVLIKPFISPPLERDKGYYVLIECDMRKCFSDNKITGQIIIRDTQNGIPDDSRDFVYFLIGDVYIEKKEKKEGEEDKKDEYDFIIIQRFPEVIRPMQDIPYMLYFYGKDNETDKGD
jgi:hypothetical protein